MVWFIRMHETIYYLLFIGHDCASNAFIICPPRPSKTEKISHLAQGLRRALSLGPLPRILVRISPIICRRSFGVAQPRGQGRQHWQSRPNEAFCRGGRSRRDWTKKPRQHREEMTRSSIHLRVWRRKHGARGQHRLYDFLGVSTILFNKAVVVYHCESSKVVVGQPISCTGTTQRTLPSLSSFDMYTNQPGGIPRVSTIFSRSMDNKQADAGRDYGRTHLARPNSQEARTGT